MNNKKTILWTIAGALTLVILLLAVTSVWAEPSQINLAAPSAVFSDTLSFQGRLLDSDGSPVDDSPMMTFRLYTQAEGGTHVWEDAFTVPVENGLFSAALEVPASLFDGQALWLGMHVEGDAQEMTPRQQLIPAPYALYAKVAPWNGLTNVPPDLTDGDDDTQYSDGTGLALVGAQFSIALPYRLPQTCSDGEIPEWNDGSGTWGCGSDDVGSGAAAWLLDGNAGTTPGVHVLGTTDATSLTLVVDTVPALRLEPGAVPNLVGGDNANQVTNSVVGAVIGGGGSTSTPNRVTDDYGTVGGGAGNQAGDDGAYDATYATVSGGYYNTASGGYASVSGGISNTASGNHATIGGGDNNTASGYAATIGGGDNNTASGLRATVGGGYYNTANSLHATIGGGEDNAVSGEKATVSGGASNTASSYHAVVGGGYDNTSSGLATTVGGGDYNTANGNWSTISGGEYNTASGLHATVGGGYINTASGTSAVVNGGYTNAASGTFATIGGGETISVTGYAATVAGGSYITVTGDYATIGGGNVNTANNKSATVGGGENNIASGDYATISGGADNTASSWYATVGGGGHNVVTDPFTTVGGGADNTASRIYATVSGGADNTASGNYAAVSGGADNTASGNYATIPGGILNSAEGDYSFAAGRQARAASAGCFVWGDSTDAVFNCGNPNRFMVRATGGVYLYTNSSLSGGMYMAPSGSSWNNYSDRQRKENFEPVDTQELLDRLAAIPISTWNYKAQAPSIRHIGPMAQDFNALLPDLGGEGEKYINTLDADGVALAAIQGLYAQNVSLQATSAALAAENTALQTQVDSLKIENAAQEEKLNDLEARLAALEPAGAPQPIATWWLPLAGLTVLAATVVAQRRQRRRQEVER